MIIEIIYKQAMLQANMLK